MNTTDQRSVDAQPIDDRLAAALRSRARGIDTDLDVLLRTIVTSAAQTRQRRSSRWPTFLVGRGPRLLAVAAVIGATVGIAAVGAALREDPEPPAVRANGQILVTGDVGEGWLEVDPIDGDIGRARGMRHVTANPEGLWDMSWSPDGSRLAYVTPDGVLVTDPALGSPTKIADCTALYPCGVAWSPDGSRIAVSADRRVDIVDPDGNIEASFEVEDGRHITQPSWSPTGDWIAYIGRSEASENGWAVRAVRPDGTSDHQVVAPVGPGMIAVDPAWSPDGTRLLYLAQVPSGPSLARGAHGGGRPNVQIMSVSVTGHEEIPSLVAPVGGCSCINSMVSFALAPDGSAYLVNTQNWPRAFGDAKHGLYLIDATTLEPRFLRPGWGTSRISWAPAGVATDVR